jgi:hypothetical protein
MPDGTHDVSFGITMTPAMFPYPELEKNARRQEMIGLCSQCHARAFVDRELSSGDAILEQSRAIVKEAEAVIRDLADRDLLAPSLQERPEHPLRGRELVLDGQMLYESFSHVERLFFKMKKYDLAKTVKGAFHQNPAYTHWYGNAELKMTLADIKAEAARLQRPSSSGNDSLKKKGEESRYLSVEEELQILKRKHDRGAISADEYEQGKHDLFKKLPAKESE